ncbi:MAG: hypothetical protein OXT09_37295 [Myxococcales bacterium]|nr:hypothetical protein [Myxococcales bacterium]
MGGRRIFFNLVVWMATLVAGGAWAQDAAPPVASVPADLVTTIDGGMYRGTIITKEPGQYVDLMLPNGETRRFEMAQVQYAGPADQQPAEPRAEPAQPADGAVADVLEPVGESAIERTATADTRKPIVTVVSDEAQLELRSADEPITFYRRAARALSSHGSAEGFDEICTSPCTVRMPSGTHTLALSLVGGAPVVAPPVQLSPGNQLLTGKVIDNSGKRGFGTTALVVGLLGGLAMAVAVPLSSTDPGEGVAAGLGISLGTMALGAIVFAVTFEGDEAEIAVGGSP